MVDEDPHAGEPHAPPPLLHIGAFLTQEGCEELKKHKYVAGAYTPLDLLLNPWWLFVATFVPAKVSPNAVTLLGMLGVFLGIAFVCYVRQGAPDVYESGHVCFLSACALMFFYQTMDAVDGKHARNTGQSTALGALFDHGCDAVTMLLGALLVELCSSLPAKEPEETRSIFGPLGCLLPLFSFFCAQWEHYHTGKMEHIGVTEAQFCAMSVMLVAGFLGPNIFWVDVLNILGMGSGLSIKAALGYSTVCFASVVVCMSWVRTIGAKGVSCLGTLLPAVVHLGFACLLFASQSPTYREHRVLCLATSGAGLVDLNIRMIIAGVCRVRFPFLLPVMMPFAAMVVVATFLVPDAGAALVWAVLLWQCISIFLLSNHAITSVCNALKIPFLSPLPGAVKKD